MNAGVYEILNVVSGKRYIGSSVDLRKRFRVHRLALNRGAHHSAFLQRAIAGCRVEYRIYLQTRNARKTTRKVNWEHQFARLCSVERASIQNRLRLAWQPKYQRETAFRGSSQSNKPVACW